MILEVFLNLNESMILGGRATLSCEWKILSHSSLSLFLNWREETKKVYLVVTDIISKSQINEQKAQGNWSIFFPFQSSNFTL